MVHETGLSASHPGRNILIGQVIAVRGILQKNGLFDVSDFAYPAVPEQKPPLLRVGEQGKPAVAFVSGLRFGSKIPIERQRQRLLDFLTSSSPQ